MVQPVGGTAQLGDGGDLRGHHRELALGAGQVDVALGVADGFFGLLLGLGRLGLLGEGAQRRRVSTTGTTLCTDAMRFWTRSATRSSARQASTRRAVDPAGFASPLFHLASGGAMLAAFFIATDPVSAATVSAWRSSHS